MDPLEEIWKTASKEGKDGQRYIFLKGLQDLGFIYVTGFVDVKMHGFKQWIDAFQDSRQKDGSYVVTHDQWLAKKKFRYDGKIGVPFDPTSIEEREYTEAEITKLLSEKIIPNTVFDNSYVAQVINNLKAQKKLVNGKMKLDREVKNYIIQFMDQYPSPTRVLELMVHGIKEGTKARVEMTQKGAQKSRFAKGSAVEKIVANRLAEIEKELGGSTAPLADVPSVSLKDLQKKKFPTGGRI